MLQIQSPTMSSREIAQLVNSRHSHVMRSIDRLAEKGIVQGYAPVGYTVPQNDQTYLEYQVTKRDSYVIVAQLSPEFTARLVDRWQELESAKPDQALLPKTFSEALQLAADQARQLELQAPMVEVYDRLANRKQDVNTTTLAKQLNTSSIKLNKWLKVNGYKWMNKDLPKSGYDDWFNVVSDVSHSGHEFTQCLITPKGQIEIAKRFK